MKLSIDNKRLTVTDNPEMALTFCQKKVFAHWCDGFDAQGRGVRFEDCPVLHRYAHKIRRLWRQGWLAAAAVDRINAEFLQADHTRNQNQTQCHTEHVQ